MEVGDGFAAVGTVINDEAVAGGGYVFAAGDVGGGEEEVSKEALIIALGVSNAGDGFFGNDKDVDRGLGGDVAEGEALVIFEDDVGGDFARDDFFEKGHASWRLSSWAR